MGTLRERTGLILSTLVMHENEIYLRSEWRWDRKNFVPLLQGTPGEETKVGCQVIGKSTHWKPTEMTV